MNFSFSRQHLHGRERYFQRACEMLPGLTSWTILVGMLVLSYWRPLAAAVIVIAFYLYWLFRLAYMTIFLVLSYVRLRIEQETDWMGRVQDVNRIGGQRDAPISAPALPGIRAQLSAWIYQRELNTVRHAPMGLPPSDEIYHLVIFPLVTERREVIEAGVESLVRQRFPTSRILLVLALEERADEAVQQGAREVQERYRHHFVDALVVSHPDGLLGEARVKGANVTYAAKHAATYLTAHHIPFERVIVSCFDADTIVGPDYFSCLTYHFMICPQRTRASFQPIPVYHNNVWKAPGFARVLEAGSSFFQLIEATNPEKLVTFSSHSMSFRALVDVGYWPVDLISDDSAIFWKSYLYFEGDYRVIPMYVTLSMDVVDSGSWWSTVKSVYRQKRRWAWGVENFPIVMRGFLRTRRIPLGDKVRHGFKLFGGHVAWATWPFLLSVIGWLSAVFAGREFSSSVLYYSVPRITRLIFHLASGALVITIILSLSLLPKSPVRYSLLRRMGHACEWLLIPLIAIWLSALPALDAQTRLMAGRYMEFWVTKKHRD